MSAGTSVLPVLMVLELTSLLLEFATGVAFVYESAVLLAKPSGGTVFLHHPSLNVTLAKVKALRVIRAS